ncbi:g2020 [Coccomyxa viridis]|uniref:G2020 protein n=1 Tax=Coccomyxa viridis TaxID=1274662 RepID=A0ABP1FN41_9CHLO
MDMQRMDSDPFSANATSQLSSDFKSAVSTSPLEHRLHRKSRLDQAHSAALQSNKRPRNSDLNQAPLLCHVSPVWLEVSQQERYLLLEDEETGDMLMPLIYMKSVFEVNYSRKLSSLKNRLVVLPSDQELSVARSNTYLYWQWAFESPPNVKLLGHLRLILLPIVYNAMAAKENLRALPLFIALQQAMRASAYDQLLRHPSTEPITLQQREPGAGGENHHGEGQAAGSTAGSRDGSPAPVQLFYGPRDMDATAAKYMSPFKEAEETYGSAKCHRMQHSVSHHDLGQTAAKVSGTVRHVMEQPGLSELREDLKDFKRRAEAQIESVTGELAIVKNCIMQLYNVLLPGKFAMQHLQAAPAMPPIPSSAQNFPPPMQPLPQPQPLQMVSSTHYGAPQHPGHPHLAAGSGQGAHSLQNMPGRSFSPAQAMAVAPGQIHSSCSIESLVSGAGGVPEGSHQSSATVMASRNMATMPQQPSMQLGPDGVSLAAMQGLQPYLQATGSQGLSNNLLQSHPSLQGALGGGGAALGLQMQQQLSTSQQFPPNMPLRGTMESLVSSRFANQGGPFPPPQLADMADPAMHMPPMPWGR